MTDKELIKALSRLKVETGSLVCTCCGHEHNCGIHGCRVIRAAAERLEAYAKTGLTPDVCAGYKKFEDECIKKGVTFYRQAPEIKKEEV